MQALGERLVLVVALFALVFAGYFVAWRWQTTRQSGRVLSGLVFNFALPALLFHLMSSMSSLPLVDMRLLLAFFGGCLIVFVIGRLLASSIFGLDGVAGSVFALGGIFSNNAMLGLPLARMMLGDAAIPSVALVMVFNALVLWSLVTVSVEWARHGSLSLRGIGNTTASVLTNPIVLGVMLGTAWNFSGIPLPPLLNDSLWYIGHAAGPLALIALGMGLAEFGVRKSWRLAAAISAVKLALMPLVVWLLARLLGLPLIETQAIVLLASMAVGANVYLMARQFGTLEGPIAASLVMSTAIASLSTPIVLMLVS